MKQILPTGPPRYITRRVCICVSQGRRKVFFIEKEGGCFELKLANMFQSFYVMQGMFKFLSPLNPPPPKVEGGRG